MTIFVLVLWSCVSSVESLECVFGDIFSAFAFFLTDFIMLHYISCTSYWLRTLIR